MASNPPGACCASGFKHEGNPVGETKNIDGVNTYFVYPKDNKTPEKAVLFLSDIYGLYSNAFLLADEFANNGYLTIIPDLFRGDQLSVSEMEAGKVNIQEWLANHQVANIDPIVEASIKYTRETLGVKKIGGVGYCFGAKYVTRFLKGGKIDVGYVAHPSFVTHEELGAIEGPYSVAAAEIDNIFPAQLRHESEATLIKAGKPWQINLFGGVSHGFAVRTDLSVPLQKWAKEQAFYQAIAWFNQYL